MLRKFYRALCGFSMIAFGLAAALLPRTAVGAPACSDPFEAVQPNGLRFEAYVRGDEFALFTETKDGYTILKNKRTGEWEYASLDSNDELCLSGTMVDPRRGAPASLRRYTRPARVRQADRLMPRQSESEMGTLTVGSGAIIWPTDWTPQPTTGTRKLLVVLVEFSNRSLATTAAQWSSRFFDTTAGARSVVNFYKDNSFNSLTVEPLSHSQSGNPAGVVTVSINQAHPNLEKIGSGSQDVAWMGPALTAASQYVNFASLDADGDGWVETTELNVYFIPAGYNATAGDPEPHYPGHAYWSQSPNFLQVQNKTLEKWSVMGELLRIDETNQQLTVGTLVHELGHAMCGLPDLYDRNYTNNGLGRFSAMAHGCWGRLEGGLKGDCPAAMDAWSRQYAGWSVPRVPSDTQTMAFAGALSSYDEPVRLPINGTSTEYFLLETRRVDSGWDRGIRYTKDDAFDWTGSGGTQIDGSRMLILHVDESEGSPGGHDINDTDPGRSVQGVVAEEPGTSWYGYSIIDQSQTLTKGKWYHTYFDTDGQGTDAYSLFNDYTSPDAHTNGGAYTGIGVYRLKTSSPTSSYLASAMVVPAFHSEIPRIEPDGGIFTQATVSLSMDTVTSGDTIKYTTDGSDPLNSGTAVVYTSPLTLTLSSLPKTVKARAFRTGYTTSPMKSATFTKNEAPTIVSVTPSSGSVNAESPCVNAGNSSLGGFTAESKDIDGQARANGTVDIGADEVPAP